MRWAAEAALVTVDPTGGMVWIRPNHLQPPFDNPTARLALLHTTDQAAIVQAIGAPAELYKAVLRILVHVRTPMETKAGTAGLEKPDLEKSKALLKEPGYDGRQGASGPSRAACAAPASASASPPATRSRPRSPG